MEPDCWGPGKSIDTHIVGFSEKIACFFIWGQWALDLWSIFFVSNYLDNWPSILFCHLTKIKEITKITQFSNSNEYDTFRHSKNSMKLCVTASMTLYIMQNFVWHSTSLCEYDTKCMTQKVRPNVWPSRGHCLYRWHWSGIVYFFKRGKGERIKNALVRESNTSLEAKLVLMWALCV